MRQVYAHQATLAPGPGPSDTGPEAAITAALPGHHVSFSLDHDQLRLRVLFATAPHRVDEARARIDEALAAGDWQLIDSGCTRVEKDDRPHARRLLHTR